MKKNNKMFLALVVVAALAAVSVAGIAMHSGSSDAALISNNVGVQDGETNSTDYSFFATDADLSMGPVNFTFTVAATGNYNGTIQLCTATSVTDKDPVVYCELQLKNASAVVVYGTMEKVNGIINAVFTITNLSTDSKVSSDGIYELTDGVPSGEFTLTKGQVEIGSAAVPFNGTVKAGSFSITSEYVSGAVVALTDDGNALLSGDVELNIVPGVSTDPNYEDPAGSLSLSGAASIQLPPAQQKIAESEGTLGEISFTSAVNVTVEDGAVITAGDAAPTMAESVSFDAGDNVEYAFLIDSSGKSIAADLTDPMAPVFKYVPFGNYTLFVIGNGGVYRGSATVSSTTFAIGSNSLSTNLGAMPDYEFDIDTGKLIFNINGSNDYGFTYALKISSSGDAAEIGKLDSAGTISFPTDVESTDMIFAIMTLRATPGSSVAFYGDVDNGTNYVLTEVDKVVTLSVVTKATDNADAGKIKAGAVTVSDTNVVFQMLDESVLTVNGEMNFLYTSATNNGVLDIGFGNAYLEFNGTGIVSHQIGTYPAEGNLMASSEVPKVFDSANLSTAYYIVNNDDLEQATYYFTSLQNAIKNSNTVFLQGNIVIKEDTTLTNPDGDLTVILTDGSTLQVGVKDDPATDEDESVTATLTVPGSTQLIISNPDAYSVENGKAVYDVKPEGNDEPLADILMEGSKFVYTDIATALDTAVSGDVLTLRQDADLTRDATVKDGVTLNDSDQGVLTILKDKTLTVAGTLNSKNGMIITGTLRVDKTANFDGADVILDGSIDVTSTGTLNVTNSTGIDGADTGVLQVDGAANFKDSQAEVSKLVIETGTLTIGTTSDVFVTKTMQVGAQPTVSTENVNNATISGVVTLEGNATAMSYGGKDIADNLKGDTDKVDYMIDSAIYVTIYCVSGEAVQIPMLYEDQLLDIVILNWNNDRMYRGDWLMKGDPIALNTDAKIGGPDSAWAIVYAQFEPKMYNVTCAYAPGVDWSVNNIKIDSSNNPSQVAYGDTVVVKAFVQSGYDGTPVILVNGSAYNGNAYKITGDVTFSIKDGSVQVAGSGSSDNNSNGGLTLIEILLIIIVIIIAIMAIIIAIRLLRS